MEARRRVNAIAIMLKVIQRLAALFYQSLYNLTWILLLSHCACAALEISHVLLDLLGQMITAKVAENV